jgi:hypothetical protein
MAVVAELCLQSTRVALVIAGDVAGDDDALVRIVAKDPFLPRLPPYTVAPTDNCEETNHQIATVVPQTSSPPYLAPPVYGVGQKVRRAHSNGLEDNETDMSLMLVDEHAIPPTDCYLTPPIDDNDEEFENLQQLAEDQEKAVEIVMKPFNLPGYPERPADPTRVVVLDRSNGRRLGIRLGNAIHSEAPVPIIAVTKRSQADGPLRAGDGVIAINNVSICGATMAKAVDEILKSDRVELMMADAEDMLLVPWPVLSPDATNEAFIQPASHNAVNAVTEHVYNVPPNEFDSDSDAGLGADVEDIPYLAAPVDEGDEATLMHGHGGERRGMQGGSFVERSADSGTEGGNGSSSDGESDSKRPKASTEWSTVQGAKAYKASEDEHLRLERALILAETDKKMSELEARIKSERQQHAATLQLEYLLKDKEKAAGREALLQAEVDQLKREMGLQNEIATLRAQLAAARSSYPGMISPSVMTQRGSTVPYGGLPHESLSQASMPQQQSMYPGMFPPQPGYSPMYPMQPVYPAVLEAPTPQLPRSGIHEAIQPKWLNTANADDSDSTSGSEFDLEFGRIENPSSSALDLSSMVTKKHEDPREDSVLHIDSSSNFGSTPPHQTTAHARKLSKDATGMFSAGRARAGSFKYGKDAHRISVDLSKEAGKFHLATPLKSASADFDSLLL